MTKLNCQNLKLVSIASIKNVSITKYLTLFLSISASLKMEIFPSCIVLNAILVFLSPVVMGRTDLNYYENARNSASSWDNNLRRERSNNFNVINI